MLPFISLIIGLLLIFFEFFLPGGLVGTAGGILFVFSLVSYALQEESLFRVVVFIVSAMFFLGLTIKLALKRVASKSSSSPVMSDDNQEGYKASCFDESVLGLEGLVCSDLKPSGHIEVAGKRYQAISKSGYINKGSKIKVTGGSSAYLVVMIIDEI